VTILTRRSASYWYSGTWSSRVRVWFGDQLTMPALETRVSLLASVGTGPRGTLPSSQSGVKVPRPGVLVTALKQKSKVKVTFMRLWELVGESGQVTVHLPPGSPARIARPVDLRGNSQATNCCPKRLIRVRAQLHCPVFIRTGIDSHVAIVVSLCADGKIEDLTNVA
jgi:hypothetical protein